MSVSQVTVLVAVASSITRAHERNVVSPAGVQPLFAENHSFPFSHTESSTRSSFVSIDAWRPPDAGRGCSAAGGGASGENGGAATSCTRTAAGGIPSTVRRWTTRDDGVSNATTYSVD